MDKRENGGHIFYIEIDGTTDNVEGKKMMGELSKVCDKLKIAGTFSPHIAI